MSDTVLHMVGHVGTDVDHRRVGSGTDLATFRLATTPRRWDRIAGHFVDGTTSWISVQCWRTLAVHVRDSVRRGDPVIVIGKLKTEEWVKDGVRNSRFVLEATAIGHDLNRGMSSFTKSTRPIEAPVDDSQAAAKAIEYVERLAPVPYDQGGSGDAGGGEVPLRDVS